eukprot:2867381-Amphidinium_carterae.1
MKLLRGRFPGTFDNMVLFPNARGMAASKVPVVLTFEVIADKLGKDLTALTDNVGRNRFSGHSLMKRSSWTSAWRP